MLECFLVLILNTLFYIESIQEIFELFFPSYAYNFFVSYYIKVVLPANTDSIAFV